MSKFSAVLILSISILCLTFTSCFTLKESTVSKEKTELDSYQGEEKILIPLREFKKQNNSLISYTTFKYDNNQSSPSETATYDSHNNLKEKLISEELEFHVQKISYVDSDSNILRYYVIKKDENENIIEKILFSGNNKLVAVEEFEYDNLGKCTEHKVYNSSENLLMYSVYSYTSGNNTRTDNYYANGTLSGYFINEYSKTGFLISTSWYDANSNLKQMKRFSYKNGLKTKEEVFNNQKELQNFTSFVYSYREQYINVTKTTWSFQGNELESVEQICRLHNSKKE